MKSPSLSEIINHLGEDRDKNQNAVAPPLYQTSNFCFPDVASMRASLKKEFELPFYTRGVNPTVSTLRTKIAALAGAEDALVFASGSAAIAAAVLSVVKAGDHVICVQKPYSWTKHLLSEYLNRFSVTCTFVDGKDPNNFRNAIQDSTVLIYLESPNSITFELQDIEAVTSIAKEHKITTILDNSFSTPFNQKAIELGVDISVHSGSKYFGGHSDLVAGILCSSSARIDRIFAEEYMTLGAIISPHEAWLMLRSLRTMPLRIERARTSTLEVANFLDQHPKVNKVVYPMSTLR